MGRPSLGPARKAQILDAALECIGAHGIVETTLERIAAQAGMSRGHVRHYVGNRDQIITDAARRFYGLLPELDDAWEPILARPDDSVAGMMDVLFGDEFAGIGAENQVVQAFVAESKANAEMALILDAAYSQTHSTLTAALQREIPGLDPATTGGQQAQDLAFDILCLALGSVFLQDIGRPVLRGYSARSGAEALVRAAATNALHPTDAVAPAAGATAAATTATSETASTPS